MIKRFWRRLAEDARGATAIEYALIAGGVAIGIATAVSAIGANLTSMLTNVSNGFH